MSITSIAGLGAIAPTGYLDQLSGAAGIGGTSRTSGVGASQAGGAAFGVSLAGSVDSLQALQSTSDGLAVKAVTGDLDDIHDYTIASSQAAVALELTAALRNKAVEAFSEIMRMQA